ncbi:MAG: MGMT family protein [Patescibacteria group bacterium]|jgi:methylated-DNA-[protein]-cysteine S-methyltransferase
MKKIDKEIKSFARLVYKLTRRIPRGKVVTYQTIARVMKNSGACRAVGNALNRNPYAPLVPCHRVIKSNGEIGGFASGVDKKKKILKKEGVKITNNRIDLVKYGYKFKIKK